jgi:hypothetical protein
MKLRGGLIGCGFFAFDVATRVAVLRNATHVPALCAKGAAGMTSINFDQVRRMPYNIGSNWQWTSSSETEALFGSRRAVSTRRAISPGWLIS